MKGPARILFVAAILTGSFLLFLVQPLVARMALPQLGGAPAVWNSAMLVYQALLLGGYAYAHAISRMPIRRQAIVHIALIAIAALTLPIALADLPPPAEGLEFLWVPLLFAATIGPVFFVVSAQAPLMQNWFAADERAGDPYWLYAASNVGSFAGLIAYPILLEPYLPLADQSLAWSAGYALLIVLVACVAAARWRALPVTETFTEGEAQERIGWKRIALWLALAAVPSGLMLSTTTHLTTDIVAMPLLWVIPLGLYLLSFTFAFSERSALGFALVRSAPLVLLLAGSLAMVSQGGGHFSGAIASVVMLFVVAVALHRRLYENRPGPARLTLFYLVMSAGGALGGLLTALVAPVVFDWVWEHPLLVLAAAALLPQQQLFGWMDRLGLQGPSRRITWLCLVLAAMLLAALMNGFVADGDDAPVLLLTLAIAVCGMLALGNRAALVAILLAMMLGRGGYDTLQTSLDGSRERSFFGIYTIRDNPIAAERTLTHGTTLHGLQHTDPQRRNEPTTYYGRDSGVGIALNAVPAIAGDGASVGVVGLGVGTLACYRKPGQEWTFFEIDPAVVEYSREGSFTYIRDCAPDADILVGDARVVLEDLPDGSFDMLVVDAFSSDAIPLHLMTAEAFAVYRAKLAPDGVLLAHISNRYLDLEPMVAALARETGMRAAIRKAPQDRLRGISASYWVALSADPASLQQVIDARDLEWTDLPAPAKTVWTDDFASILPYLEWDNVLGL
ncbi:fused MFS/spermidine synthase [Qipengyuania sp. JC766]|uniref:fused MFS/spermidine synthase n=1 Tax=Qipengyuania sp. JC766 TaxID=3232139 RepID=UPI00345ABA3D